MTAPELLRKEGHRLSRYLAGITPSEYVLDRYVEAHQRSPAYLDANRFDRWLAGVTSVGPVTIRLADAYTRVFAQRSNLRRKLTLMLAILEVSPGTHTAVASTRPSGIPLAVARVALHGLAGLIAAVVAALLLTPLHVAAFLADLVAQ